MASTHELAAIYLREGEPNKYLAQVKILRMISRALRVVISMIRF